ncbi:DUF2163 domain-containing protein [Mesorhizobium australicum]|uniref:Bacteriophage phiJL001 Gp84 C-terminal domain-containing protein n=1 Tax=Mesorhizobium australicum TaxID=536018 RepID=A0A1X7NXD7_9HYPH|nr:DUF2163 domain-containing protein [Mesorhizobium australicum]SMH42948.1 phage conserved hypothetical protein BR0599 [Mesorhizobium australicum]
MSGFSEDFLAHLARDVTTLCHCWTVARTDGFVLGFTDHDRTLTVGGASCEPQSGMTATEARDAIGLAGDATDVEGALSSDAISEADIAAGRYDGAVVTTYLVNWRAPEQNAVVRRATVGKITRADGAFRVELNGPAASLEKRVGRHFRRTCDARLGDGRCGFDLTQEGFHGAGAVTEQRGAEIDVSGLDTFAASWFAHGELNWTSGALDGRTARIAVHRREGSRVTLTLDEGGEGVETGDAFAIVAGCDKRFETCRTKFANRLNFRGFPHMPGNDAAYAYVTDGIEFDGGALVP